MKKLSRDELNQEFQRQVETLLKLNYPLILKISEEEFLKHILPLKEKLSVLDLPEADLEQGYLPFVIVIKHELITSEVAMAQTRKNDKGGVTILRPLEAKDFKTIEGISIPKGMSYLLIDVDRGKENINLPPNQAIEIIKKAGRCPLTIDEGVAIVTFFPDFLIKNNCFSLLASRTGKDQRVPAIWINAKKEPNLGWCWDGNPHTWLGSSSARTRIGVDSK